MLQAYNDWAIDEWCGAYPGRFIPLGIVPMWDVDAAVAEVRRIAKKGCRSISFLETPHVQGFPSFLSGYWDPMLAALSEENMVLSLHIGAGFKVIQRAGGGTGRPPHGAGLPDQRHHRPGPAVRPDAAALPRPQGRPVRGRDRLDPLLLRPDRPALHEPGVAARRLRRQAARPRCSATTSWPATSPTPRACCCGTASASTTSPGSATTRTPTRRGPSRPSSPGRSSRTPGARTRRSTRSPGRTPAASTAGTPSPTRPGSRRRWARCGRRRRDVDVTRMSADEWRTRNEAAGIGVVRAV